MLQPRIGWFSFLSNPARQPSAEGQPNAAGSSDYNSSFLLQIKKRMFF